MEFWKACTALRILGVSKIVPEPAKDLLFTRRAIMKLRFRYVISIIGLLLLATLIALLVMWLATPAASH